MTVPQYSLAMLEMLRRIHAMQPNVILNVGKVGVEE